MHIPSWVSPVLAIFLALPLPWLIQYVAKSGNRLVNLLISYGSSALVGVLSAWIAGNFSSDIWMTLTAVIAATQVAYNGYWKQRIAVQPEPEPEQ